MPRQEQELSRTLPKQSSAKASDPFPACGPLGFYPIVDSAHWVERMLGSGVKTIQLRIKDKNMLVLEEEIEKSIALAEHYKASLFINDYWALAVKHGAYGVHLGQEDLLTVDVALLRRAKLRLGVSTHSYEEIACVLPYQPSYVACGPIYHTDTKKMAAAPQGLERLKDYCRILSYPVVAIGGIKWDMLEEVCATGVKGIAAITAITEADEPEEEALRWGRKINSLLSRAGVL